MVENAAAAQASSIVDRLAGKTILLTGVTGFLGQVIFERLLGDVPEGRIVLLVRSQTGSTSRARVEYLFRKPAFDVVRGRIGEDGLRAILDERVTIVDGDFSRGVPELPGDIDIAIHSAATVAFDPPIDEGFQTNLFGAMNLYRGVIESGSRPCLVHISTAYVAGVAKGVVPEDTLDHRVDWRTEGELALQARRDVEAPVASPGDARRLHGQGVEGTFARRPDGGGRGRRATAQGLGVEASDPLRPVARPLARMARRLHVHEGDGRTGRRGARGPRGPAAVDRSPVDHRERAGASRPRGGSTGSRWPTRSSAPTGWVRSRSSPASPRGSRHHPGGHGRERDPGGRGHAAAVPAAPRTTTSARAAGTRSSITSCIGTCASTSRPIRCRNAGAASTRCPSGRSRAA